MQALEAALRAMKCIGVDGIVVEVVWGQVEARAPRQYVWAAHQRLFQMLLVIGLRARVRHKRVWVCDQEGCACSHGA